MKLIMRALDKDKQRIREFPVSFYEKEMAIIYEFLPEHITFLENLVIGIQDLTNKEIFIICTSTQMFSEVSNYQKVKYEDGQVELINPKKDLPKIVLPV